MTNQQHPITPPAELVAEEPSNDELLEMFNENDWNYISPETFEDITRAVLARWGHPTPQPVAVSERLPPPEPCDKQGRCWKCLECGYIISDLQKRSFVCSMPCPGCGRPTDSYAPQVGLRLPTPDTTKD